MLLYPVGGDENEGHYGTCYSKLRYSPHGDKIVMMGRRKD